VQSSRLEAVEIESKRKEEELGEVMGELEEGEMIMQEEQEPLWLSLSALNDINTYSTMRVVGRIKNNPLHILIDSGSTHNFLDITIAKKTSL